MANCGVRNKYPGDTEQAHDGKQIHDLVATVVQRHPESFTTFSPLPSTQHINMHTQELGMYHHKREEPPHHIPQMMEC